MKVLTLEAGPDAGEGFLGSVLCQTVGRSASGKSIALRKGQVVHDDELAVLRSVERQRVRVIQTDLSDVHEDDAGRRLARAVAGPGLRLQGPTQSRMNLIATTRGIAVVDVAGLREINLVPDMSVFTVLPYQPVEERTVVAGAKVVPVVTREEYVAAAERIAVEHRPLIEVKPYLPLRVGVVSKQRPDPTMRARFEDVLRRKLSWFGASLAQLRYTEKGIDAVKAGLRAALDAGSDLILTAGSAAADPLDSIVVAVEELGGRLEVRGTPAHPGSFFWLAYLDGRPIFGMPSCGAYSESTVVDLLLVRAMAGIRLTRVDIAELGAGGLFGRGMEARFPSYDLSDATAAAESPSEQENSGTSDVG